MKSLRIFLTIFVAILVAGCSTLQISQENQNSQSSWDSAMHRETYTNAKYGFTFQYPSDWSVKEKIDTKNNVEFLNVYVSNILYRDNQYYWALDDGQSLFMVSVQSKNDILPWGGRMALEKNFKLGGVNAHKGPTELTDGGPGTGIPTAIEVSAYKNDVEYVVNLVPPDGPLTDSLEEILSTFIFTK